MSKLLTSLGAFLLCLSMPAFAEESRPITETEKAMIEKIESTSELKFAGFKTSDPNDPVALFEPNQAAIKRLRGQGRFKLSYKGDVHQVPASLELLYKNVSERGPLKLSWWNETLGLTQKSFYVNEVSEQVKRLTELLPSFDVSYSDVTDELKITDRNASKSAVIYASQVGLLLKDVEAKGEPVIIAPSDSRAELTDLRYDGYHKKLGESLGKAMHLPEKTYFEQNQGFITYLMVDGLPHGLLVPHRLGALQDAKVTETLAWLAKPSTQDPIFGQQLRRKEWLKKKGFILEAIYLDLDGLKFQVRHHSKKNSKEYYYSIPIAVDESYDAFVKRVSKINSDYEEDPNNSWMNSPEVENKRKLRAAKKMMNACEATFGN